MAAIARSTVSLRIFGDGLDPVGLSNLLHATRDESWRKGDDWIIRGRPPRTRRIGAWLLHSAAPKSAPFEEHLRDVLGRTTTDVAVWESVTRSFDADIFCGLFMDQLNEGFDIPADLLRILADRRLMIGFDVYGPTSDSAPPDKRAGPGIT